VLGIRRPHLRELFSPVLKKTTIVATLLFACTAAPPYGAMQHTVRMIPRARRCPKPHCAPPGTGSQRCAILRRTGRPGGPHTLCSLHHSHCLAAQPHARFSYARAAHLSLALFLRGNSKPDACLRRNVFGRAGLQRATPFLGKLPSENVPNATPGLRRELCGEYRRQSDRCVCRSRDNELGKPEPRRKRVYASCVFLLG
jgi:hypothetical protein